jgi:hypothetical protein
VQSGRRSGDRAILAGEDRLVPASVLIDRGAFDIGRQRHLPLFLENLLKRTEAIHLNAVHGSIAQDRHDGLLVDLDHLTGFCTATEQGLPDSVRQLLDKEEVDLAASWPLPTIETHRENPCVV